MIKSFRHKGLAEIWERGFSSKIDRRFLGRIVSRLDALDAATEVSDMNVPGFSFHTLRGFLPQRFTVHINGPWCITFEFENGEASKVDFEQYH